MCECECKLCEQCEREPKAVNPYEVKITPENWGDCFEHRLSGLLVFAFIGYYLLWRDGFPLNIAYVLGILYFIYRILDKDLFPILLKENANERGAKT